MSEINIRRLTSGNSEQIIGLWTEIFGDSPELVEVFLDRLFRGGAGFGAFDCEKLISMAYVLTGLEITGQGKYIPCGYIYAVATDEGYRRRGIAEELCRKCTDAAVAQGCEIITVKPSGEKLYSYYGRVIGTDRVLHCRKETFGIGEAAGESSAEPVSAEEYFALREKALSGTPHLRVSKNWLGFEKELCRGCGGDLYSVGGSPAAAYSENGILIIKELICPDREKAEKVSALCLRGGVEVAELCTPCAAGEKNLAADSDSISPGTHFGILFD